MRVIIASGTPHPDLPAYSPRVRCRLHPRKRSAGGYGLHGGGIGPYTYCTVCNRCLSKSLDPDAQPVEIKKEDD